MRVTPKQKANHVLNFLHKGFVLTCVGVTLWGTSVLGYRFLRYMMVTRPQFIEQRKLDEERLLAEGSSENLKETSSEHLD